MQSTAQETRTSTDSSRTITLEKKDAQRQRVPAIPGREPEVAFLPFALHSRHLPEDFEIGPLQDLRSGSRAERKIVQVVDHFCLGLTRAKLDTELIDGPKRGILSNSLTHYLTRGILPDAYRIGAVTVKNGTGAVVPVRLFSNTGVTEGHIYLVEISESWLISDMQINFQELSEQYVPRDEKYTPSYHGWRLNGY